MSKISVFGLGYVGAVSAACFANQGHSVIGVDPNKMKVSSINEGLSPIIEAELTQLIDKAVVSGNLYATTETQESINKTEISFICVGTPSQSNGDLDLTYIKNVCKEIGLALRQKNDFHIVVIRSTILPGTTQNIAIPILEECSGKKAGKEFGVCYNPEFLREGTAIEDFRNPPKTVIGEMEKKSGNIVSQIYSNLHAPMICVEIKVAEMVKYVDNTWHAAKVCFANEIGSICKVCGIDSHKVMDIFCADTKLNLSSYYMKPGFAFGGSCLPKDVRALTYKGKHCDLDLPLLNAVMPSNRKQVERGIDMIKKLGNKKIGVLGFSFKAGTDDMRESPIVEVIEYLLGKGYDIKIYDRSVNLAQLVGANKKYMLSHIPHVCNLMVSTIEDIIKHSQIIVVGNKSPEFLSVLGMLREEQKIVDLVRLTNDLSGSSNYSGICW